MGELVEELKARYGIWTWGAGCLGDDGLLYMRLSAAVYNDLHEYERLRDAVLEILNGRARVATRSGASGSGSGSGISVDESHAGASGGTKRPRSTL